MTTCLEKSCSFGFLYVSFVNVYQFVCVLLSFEGGMWDLIVLVPDLCLSFLLYYCACYRCGWALFGNFFSRYHISFYHPFLSEMARYRVNYFVVSTKTTKTRSSTFVMHCFTIFVSFNGLFVWINLLKFYQQLALSRLNNFLITKIILQRNVLRRYIPIKPF